MAFKAPCNCTAVDGLKAYYPTAGGNIKNQIFLFTDAHGNNLTGIGNLFQAGAIVKAILNVDEGKAYLQNADTNAYLEGKISAVQTAASNAQSTANTAESNAAAAQAAANNAASAASTAQSTANNAVSAASAAQSTANSKAAKPSTGTATLAVSSWDSTALTQKASVSGVTASSIVLVAPAPASQEEYSAAGVKCTAQGGGTLTFACTKVPEAELIVNVVILGV